MRRSPILPGFLLALLSAVAWSQDTSSYYSMLQGSDGTIYGIDVSNYDNGGPPDFFSYSPGASATTILNANVPYAQLCLETPAGTFYAVASGKSSSQIIQLTTAGAVSTIATFPYASETDIYASCPVIANDGNYYGTAVEGGAYSHGYLYQLTSGGQISDIYDFTGTADGNAPQGQPVQGSNGTFYFPNYSSLVTYNTSTGLSVIPASVGYGPLVEASDGNFYTIPAGNPAVLQIKPSGATKVIYSGPQPVGGALETYFANGVLLQGDDKLTVVEGVEEASELNCSENTNLNYLVGYPIDLSGNAYPPTFQVGTASDDSTSTNLFTLSPLYLSGNGAYYGWLQDATLTEACYYCCTGDSIESPFFQAPSPQPTPPIQLAFSKSHILPGGSSTFSWKVNNAYSATMQQCYGYGGIVGSMVPVGQVGLSGTATVSLPGPESFQASIVCGGTEAATATLTAGDAVLIESTSATSVPVGASFSLTGQVTNPGSPGPTGSVNFYAGSLLIGTGKLNASGIGTFTVSTAGIPTGTYPILAKYAGDANYGAASAGPISVSVVSKSATATVLSPASQIAIQGGPAASFTATVTGNNSSHQPSGTANFLLGDAVLGTRSLVQGASYSSATFSVSAAGVQPGTYPITASYAGDAWNYGSSSGVVTVTVQTDSVSLVASPNPVPANTPVTLTATAAGSDTPTGTIIFYAGGTSLGSHALAQGIASITVPAGTLAEGDYQLTAYYAGDKNNPAVTSPAITLTVQ